MWRSSLIAALLAPHLFAACQCNVRFGVCDEVHESDAVFIGTVESVAPPYMDPYVRARGNAPVPSSEITRLQADESGPAVETLKKIYLDMFIGLPESGLREIRRASTQHELEMAFETIQSEGRFARFKVRKLYKLESGDDDDKPAGAKPKDIRGDDDDKEAPKSLDIWTSGGDCGFTFQPGETYIVYAITDEDSGKLETSVCMRTRRLSDESGDLSFLYLFENDRENSTQLTGFVSTSFADQNMPRYEDSINSPYEGALLELDTGVGMRYTESAADGRFTFAGLKEGDYKLSVLSPGYPLAGRTEILSRRVHAPAGSCLRQIFVLPQPVPR